MIMKLTSLNNKISAKSDCGGGMDGVGGINIMRQSSCEDELKRKRPEWHTLRRLTEGSLPWVWVLVWEGVAEKWVSRGGGRGWRACRYTLSVATTVTEQSLLPLYNMKAECTLSYNLNTSSSKAFLYNLSHIRGILKIKNQLL